MANPKTKKATTTKAIPNLLMTNPVKWKVTLLQIKLVAFDRLGFRQ